MTVDFKTWHLLLAIFSLAVWSGYQRGHLEHRVEELEQIVVTYEAVFDRYDVTFDSLCDLPDVTCEKVDPREDENGVGE